MQSSFKHNDIRTLQQKPLSRAVQQILLSTALAAAAPVLAQTADNRAEQAVEVISVTGTYSRSLEKAVDLNKTNIGFSDSIVATDVADFPEQNLAEAPGYLHCAIG